MIVSLYFKAELPLDAVRTLIAEARTNPAGVVAVDAALHVAGSLNAYRGDDRDIGPFAAPGLGDKTFEQLCDKVEAYLPDDEKDGVPGYEANPMLEALLAALIQKILARFLPTL